MLLPIALLAATLVQAPAPPASTGNAEMKRIFAADQAARTGIKPEQYRDPAFVRKMIADDTARRARTRELLDAGSLTTAEDFHAAAFVFQHGGKPDDYLLAHSLALAAIARGMPEARWIAAATLDRYLMTLQQKQIYGTQFTTRRGEPTTQEPYDRALIPDSLRTALGVPPLAEQEKRLAEMRATAAD